MRLAGFQLEEIGDELSMTAGGVHELLRGYMASVPPGGVEDYRLVILGRLDDAHAVAHSILMKAKDTKTKLGALRSINQLARTFAMVGGVVRQQPPMIIVNNGPRELDLSRLTVEEIEFLKGVQTKLLEPPIDVRAEIVEDENGNEREERNEQPDGDGDASE